MSPMRNDIQTLFLNRDQEKRQQPMIIEKQNLIRTDHKLNIASQNRSISNCYNKK